MTMKTAACAVAVALLAGTASFAVPAAAQSAPTPWSHAKMAPSHAKRLFMSAVAEYDAGLRRGRANATDNAYLRGFRDGTSTAAYSSRRIVVDSYAGNPIVSVPQDAYGRAAVYSTGTGGYYSSYDGRRSAYYDNGNGYESDRYDARPAPLVGLMDVVSTPLAIGPTLEAQDAHLNYCAARYQTFDAASNTFLASDGNRYYCR